MNVPSNATAVVVKTKSNYRELNGKTLDVNNVSENYVECYVEIDGQMQSASFHKDEIISFETNVKVAISDIVMELAKHGIEPILKFMDGEVYYDLNTQTKSHLSLFTDGTLRGRYAYESKIDLHKEMSDIIYDLCVEFENATYGRDFWNEAWYELCKKNDVSVVPTC